MPYSTLPIVGSHFGPQRGSPSKALIAALAVGTPLHLMAEPENPVDINAVAVYVNSTDIPTEAYPMLEEELPNYGFALETIMEGDEWHLGYIPKDFARQLRETETVNVATPYDVTFGLAANGAARVRFEEPVL